MGRGGGGPSEVERRRGPHCPGEGEAASPRVQAGEPEDRGGPGLGRGEGRTAGALHFPRGTGAGGPRRGRQALVPHHDLGTGPPTSTAHALLTHPEEPLEGAGAPNPPLPRATSPVGPPHPPGLPALPVPGPRVPQTPQCLTSHGWDPPNSSLPQPPPQGATPLGLGPGIRKSRLQGTGLNPSPCP